MSEPQSTIEISLTVEALIAAPARAVYALVADLPRMGEWSPENLGSVWIEGAPGEVGSRFMGHNRNSDEEWEGCGIVITATPGEEFAWVMGDDPSRPHGTWRYCFSEATGGTRVVESYELGPGSSGFRVEIAALPEHAQQSAVDTRAAQLRDGMQNTLERLKAHAETLIDASGVDNGSPRLA